MTATTLAAAYGGPGWTPRRTSLREEIGDLWGECGVASEWAPLRAVLLHRPGAELATVEDPGAALMLGRPDAGRAGEEHDALAAAYAGAGVEVAYVEPPEPPPPNLMFVADLFFMTPEGAIVGRPASRARAGEERWVARRLADRGVPIVRTVAGAGTFEGADAMWIVPGMVLLGRGLRTNEAGAAQVATTLREMGVDVVTTDLPLGTMHLMGQLRIVDRDLAFVQEGRIGIRAVEALRGRGYQVRLFPRNDEVARGMAHNFVTLGPRRILMPAGRPGCQAIYEAEGVTCVTTPVESLMLAAGGIGCLTGILRRDLR